MGAPRAQAVRLAQARRSALARRARPFLLVALCLGLGYAVVRWALEPLAVEIPAAGGVYREAVVGEALDLDPLGPEQAPRDPDLTPLLFRGLVEVDPGGQVRPDLAESWLISRDGLVYTFLLRQGLRWDDGQPITASDVVFSVRRAAVSSGPGQETAFWSNVEVRALEPSVVEFALREPLGGFIERAALPLVAVHAAPNGRSAADVGPPATNGPYRVTALGQSTIFLERNALYHAQAGHLDRIEFIFFPGREAALKAFLAGQVDALSGLTADERHYLSMADGSELHELVEYNKSGVLVFNTQDAVLGERRVRRAIALALDPDTFIQRSQAGMAEPAVGPLSPLSWAYAPGESAARFDPAGSRALLEAAGWEATSKGGPRRRGAETLSLTLLMSDSTARWREAAEIGHELRAVGIDVSVKTVAVSDLRPLYLDTGEFQAALVGRWLAETDPDQFSLWHSTQVRGLGGNYSGISSPDLDRWLELGRRRVVPEERKDAYARFQLAWAEEQPSVVLYYPHASFALSRDIRGVRDGPLPDASWRLRQLPEWYRQTVRAFASWAGR